MGSLKNFLFFRYCFPFGRPEGALKATLSLLERVRMKVKDKLRIYHQQHEHKCNEILWLNDLVCNCFLRFCLPFIKYQNKHEGTAKILSILSPDSKIVRIYRRYAPSHTRFMDRLCHQNRALQFCFLFNNDSRSILSHKDAHN